LDTVRNDDLLERPVPPPVADGSTLAAKPVSQFAGFVGVGIASASLSLVTRFLANLIVPFELAVGIAHVVGMLFSFTVNRLLIFPMSRRAVWDELARFTLVNLVSLTIATGVSSWVYRMVLPSLGITEFTGLIAHVIGLGACTLPSFLGHKFFSFRQSRRSENSQTATGRIG